MLPEPYPCRNSRYGWSTTLSTIQQTPSPWWCRLLLQRHGCGESFTPTPGSLLEEGAWWRRFGRVLFIYANQPRNKLITKLYDQFLLVPKQLNYASPMVHTDRMSYSFPPPPFQHVFGWLLCINIPIRSNRRATFILFRYFLAIDSNNGTAPPHAPSSPLALASTMTPTLPLHQLSGWLWCQNINGSHQGQGHIHCSIFW